jgi:hypothetical protein
MSSIPKIIIISGTDDKYFVVANDLFLSLKAQGFDFEYDLGLLDVGLGEPPRQHFIQQGIKVEKVRSDIDYPAREHWEKTRPSVRTLTARPFLRSYFPGYDIYIWLDADVWVQTPEALNHIVASAKTTNAIHLAPELDRCYQPFFQQDNMWQIYHDWYQANYGNDIAKAMLLMPMLNAGVFAMGKDSPVWDGWAKIYRDVLQNVTDCDSKSFMADQLGLNILVYLYKLPCVRIPVLFNWLTCFALPYFDRKTNLYVESGMPYRAISQIHLTRSNKLQSEKIQCLDGAIIERPLMFSTRYL